ncbi:hypothetical protein A1O7_02287 [Cladophialophora yegresii CBS 114405]|uniref:L-ornithine N(5)-monooxygenase n=1 Tax=Cladophialophora yegresii CBS 114405 TaxID=1182544 RepID=W9W1D0_9EURO|nr:uncharacterized protein A1O7_02287 [Cladophialophora yegresii CBS 114405]EXJ61857.1 hypothetical protein A1O7_02287 [Cladophialophora yegresii CBS 114405]
MDHGAPREIDTIIVGNGPSALILSYILHGHIPYYDQSSPHPDSVLHERLLRSSHDLLNIDIDFLTEPFSASRFSYSTQALPVNVLLDTLVRPLGETDDGQKKTCVKWQYEPSRAVAHAVLGQTQQPGGQWVDNPVQASWDIGTLSYAGMLSLPGYGFDEHYQRRHGQPLPIFLRPSRRAVADYLAAYPDQVGISDSIYNGEQVGGVARHGDGFFISSHNIHCRNLVLASGIFSELIAPRPLLRPLLNLKASQSGPTGLPLLVIGSGFSAADVIISSPSDQKIIHIYKWAPSTSPSPLRGCHQHAYPEYAGVYRRMKLAALSSSQSGDKRSRPSRRASEFGSSRHWQSTYEGLPNTEVKDVQIADGGLSATITLQRSGKPEQPFQRQVSGLAYVVGRRGSLDYLSPDLLGEIIPGVSDAAGVKDSPLISGQTLREKANENLELAAHVFVTGSLTGDSLIRFAYGGCAYAAGKIMQTSAQVTNGTDIVERQKSNGVLRARLSRHQTPVSSPKIPAMNGLDGHEASPVSLAHKEDLPLDRRKES